MPNLKYDSGLFYSVHQVSRMTKVDYHRLLAENVQAFRKCVFESFVVVNIWSYQVDCVKPFGIDEIVIIFVARTIVSLRSEFRNWCHYVCHTCDSHTIVAGENGQVVLGL